MTRTVRYKSFDIATRQDAVLSTRPGASVWKDFFDFVRSGDTPQDWMNDRPCNIISPDHTPLFDEEDVTD